MTTLLCDLCKKEVTRFVAKSDGFNDVVSIGLPESSIGDVSYNIRWDVKFTGVDICQRCLLERIMQNAIAPRT